MGDDGFEQFKRDFSDPERRSALGYAGMTQAHAEALIANSDRGVNTTLRGMFNQRLAIERAAATNAVRASSARRQSDRMKLGAALVIAGLLLALLGFGTANERTTDVALPCFEHQYTGDQAPRTVCPIGKEPLHDGVWTGLEILGYAGLASLVGGVVVYARRRRGASAAAGTLEQ